MPSRTRTAVDPITKSRTTYHLNNDDLAAIELSLTECDSLSSADSFLGVALVKNHRQTANNEAIDELLAPSLGCYPLQVTSTKTEKDGKQLKNESIVTQITMGEPDPQPFVVPSEYVERGPSQVLSKEVIALDEVYKKAQH